MLARDGATSQGRGEEVDREGWEVECLEEEVRWSREEVTISPFNIRLGITLHPEEGPQSLGPT